MTTKNQSQTCTHEQLSFCLRYADSTIIRTILQADLEGTPLPTGYPPWVIKCGQKVCRELFPLVYQSKEGNLSNPEEAGLVLGMMKGGEACLQGELSKVDWVGFPEPTKEQMIEASALIFGKDSGLSIPESGDTLIPHKITEDFRAYDETLALPDRWKLQQSLADGMGMLAGHNASTEATQIQKILLVFWRVIEQCKTSEQVFNFLTAVLGSNIVGSDPKRVLQICTRLGKRFPRGRPKKPQRAKPVR